MNSDNVISVRELREARGWSLRKTALLVGLSPSELSRVEVGERGLSGAARMRMISAFDLKATDVRRIAELDPFTAASPGSAERSYFQPGTRPACSIHLCISGPCASSRVVSLT
ncbi:MAG TPA: helix-turn-helix transcriptional regulator [Actinomycetota bacterium]|nr:helix-turn-helix transcriptional regulator [Actinomycetota bacterium]